MRGAADVRPGAGKFTGGRLPVGGQRMVGASPNDHHGDVQQARAWHDLGCYHAVNLASRPTTCGGAPRGRPSVARILRSDLAFAAAGPARRIVI
jgi:hypothetical protein